MLRLWEECNPNHKIDYCMDEVDQELGSEVAICNIMSNEILC